MDPQKAYEARLAECAQSRITMRTATGSGAICACFFCSALLVVAFLLRSSVMVGLFFLGVFLGVFSPA